MVGFPYFECEREENEREMREQGIEQELARRPTEEIRRCSIIPSGVDSSRLSRALKIHYSGLKITKEQKPLKFPSHEELMREIEEEGERKMRAFYALGPLYSNLNL